MPAASDAAVQDVADKARHGVEGFRLLLRCPVRMPEGTHCVSRSLRAEPREVGALYGVVAIAVSMLAACEGRRLVVHLMGLTADAARRGTLTIRITPEDGARYNLGCAGAYATAPERFVRPIAGEVNTEIRGSALIPA